MDIYKVVLDVPSIATCGSYSFGRRNIHFVSPFDIEFYGSGKEFFWSFGDGQSGDGSAIDHEYDADGDYTVVLYVRDKETKRIINTVFSKVVRVDTENSLVAIAGPDTVEIGNEINFDGSDSYVDNLPATAYYWKIDGQLTSREPNINYNFNRVGTHKIELEVGVLDERVMELSSSCIAREIEVVTPIVYQRTVGLKEGSEGFSYSSLVPDQVLLEMDVEQESNDLQLENDYVKTWQNESKTFSVFENDRTPGIALEKVITVSGAENGKVWVQNPNYGLIVYEPHFSFKGYDKFTYTARSRDGKIATASVVVSVMEKVEFMEGMSVTDDLLEIKDEASIVYHPLQNDENVIGAEQKIVALTQPANGTVKQVGLQGLIEYTPNASFQGADAFTYLVEDETGKQNTASVVIKVKDVTDPEVYANPDYIQIEQDGQATIKVLENDNYDGKITLKSISDPNNGTNRVINAYKGTVFYVPDRGFYGTDAFTYTIENDNGVQSSSSVTVLVDEKRIKERPLMIETYQRSLVNAFLFDELSVPKGYEIVGELSPKKGKATVADAKNGIISYIPESDFVGYDLFYVKLRNDDKEVIVSVIVKVLEHSKLLKQYGIASNSIGLDADARSIIDPYSFKYNELSKDNSIIEALSPEEAASLIADGRISFDYTQINREQTAMTYQVRGEDGKLNAGAVVIHPTDELGVPKLTSMVLQPDVVKTKTNNPSTVYPLMNDRHLKDGELALFDVGRPLNGTVVLNKADNSILYVPNIDFKGSDAFTYTVIDEGGKKATSAINVIILDEREWAMESEGYNPRIKAFDYVILRPEYSQLTPELLIDATDGLFGEVKIINENTGEIQYVPQNGFSGVDRYSYSIKNADGSLTSHSVVAVVGERSEFIPGERGMSDRVIVYDDEDMFNYALLNKVHPDGKDMRIVSVIGDKGGIGSVLNDKAFGYQTLEGFNGLDKITYVLMDDEGKLEVNYLVLDIRSASERGDLDPLTYESPVNIPINISLKERALGLGYHDHTSPLTGQFDLV